MAGFNFGLGADVSKQNETKTTVGTSNTTGTQTGTQNSSGTSTQGTTTSQTGTTTGATSQTGTQDTTQVGTQDTKQVTTGQSLSDQVIAALNDALGGALGKTTGATNPALAKLGSFDPAQYINDTMNAATARTNQQVGTSLGGIKDAIGGGVNSAVALLSNQVQNDAASSLAGIRATATGTANDILNKNANAFTADTSGSNSILQTILGALKGATTTETGAGTTATSQAGTTASSTAGTSTETTAQTGKSDTVSSFIQALSSLLNQNSTTNSNSTTKDDISKIDASGKFGFS